jgi:hypothetical protein
MQSTHVRVQCDLCCYPSWSIRRPRKTSLDPYEICLESFGEVVASAEKDCDGCKFISQIWQSVCPDAADREGGLFNFNQSSGSLWVHIFTQSLGEYTANAIDVFTLPGKFTPIISIARVMSKILLGEKSFMHVRVASLLPPSTHLDSNISHIRTWLSACEQMHPKCRAISMYVPPRLLDIASVSAGFVKLIVPSPIVTSQYACLSHCWGHTRSKHITCVANLSLNMTGIPVAELPKTFTDAIDTSKALGLQYLWIDSLCIIQDSQSDWTTHVDIMASIYENAYITLAAGASSDDDGGIFTVPSDLYTKPQCLGLQLGSEKCNIYVRRSVDHPDAKWPAVEVLPLMRRGWCFQERLLSRRYLCFGSKELMWECLEDVACSCSMASGPFNPRDRVPLPRFKDCIGTKMLLNSAETQCQTVWRSLVSEYATRQLTYPNDKLPALAGLANFFQVSSVRFFSILSNSDAQRKFDAGSYVHGLWASSLEQDLAWSIWGNESSVGRPRASPSWSWAACVDSKIEWTHLYESDHFQLRSILQQSEEPLRMTALSVSGILCAVSIQVWKKRTKLEERYSLVRFCQIIEHGDCFDQKASDTVRLARSYPPLEGSFEDREKNDPNTELHPPSQGEFRADYRFWSSDEALQLTLQNLVFCMLGEEDHDYPSPESPKDEACWVAGMVLRSTKEMKISFKGNELQQFERIGWLRYSTRQARGNFEPAGTRSHFLLV